MIKKLILSLSLFSCSILLTDKSNAQDVVVTCDGCSPLEMSHTAESFLETNTDYNAVDVMVYSPSTGVFREFRVARTHVQDESLNLDQDSCSNHTTGLYVQSVLQELKIKQAFTEPQLQATGDSFVQLGGSLDKSDFFLHGTYRSAAEALEFPDQAASFIEDAIGRNSLVKDLLKDTRAKFCSTDSVVATIQFDDSTVWEIKVSIGIGRNDLPKLRIKPTLIARLIDDSVIPLERFSLRDKRFTSGDGNIQSLLNLFNSLPNVDVVVPKLARSELNHYAVVGCLGSDDDGTTTCTITYLEG